MHGHLNVKLILMLFLVIFCWLCCNCVEMNAVNIFVFFWNRRSQHEQNVTVECVTFLFDILKVPASNLRLEGSYPLSGFSNSTYRKSLHFIQ